MKRSEMVELLFKSISSHLGIYGTLPENDIELSSMILSDLEDAGMVYIDNNYDHGWEYEDAP